MKIKTNNLIILLAAVALSASLVANSAHAADITKAATGTDLAVGTSWGGTAPAAADVATWESTSLGAGLTLGSATSWDGIKVNGALSDIDITGAGALTLGTGGIDLSGSGINMSIANDIALNGSQSWSSISDLTASGVISGSGTLTLNGNRLHTRTHGSYLATGTPTMIFPNTKLSRLTSVSGTIAGDYVNGEFASTAYFFVNDGTTATYQLQVIDGSNTKVAMVELTQVGPDIYARQTDAKYEEGDHRGTDFTSFGNAGNPGPSNGYGVKTSTITYVSSTLVHSSYLTGTAATIFPDTDLSGVTSASGTMAGGWLAGGPFSAETYHFSNVGTTATYQLQVDDGGTIKVAKVQLTQVGPDIQAHQVYAKYKVGSENLGADFDDAIEDGTPPIGSGGYGVNTTTVNFDSTITFSGTSTYTGDTIVEGGTLTVGDGAGSGSIAGGGVVVSNDAVFAIDRGATEQIWANDFSGEGTLRIEEGQDPQFSGNNSSFTGPVIIDGVDAQFRTRGANAWSGQSVVTITNGGMASVFSYVNNHDIKAGSLWGDGTVRLGAAGGNRGLIVGGNNQDSVFSGTIVNDAGGIGFVTKTGTGTLTLSGANTFNGNVAVNGGILKFGTDGNNSSYGPLGDDNTAVTKTVVASGATLDINGHDDTNYGVTIAGTGTDEQGALINNGVGTGNGQIQTPNITLSADASIGGTGNFYMLASGYGANTLDLAGNTLTKTGNNTFFLANTTVTTGDIQISEGTLAQFKASDASAAAVILDDTAGVTLDLWALPLTVGSLSGGGTTGGNVIMNNTLTVGALNTPTTFGGVISSSGSLIKTGAGTLTFSGVNTYNGTTTIGAGTLALSGTGSIADTPSITVASGASFDVSGTTATFALGSSQTLGGNGTVTGNVDINGTVAPSASVGTLTVNGDVTFASGSTLDAEFNASANDTLIVNGTCTIGTSSGGFPTLNLTGLDTLNLNSQRRLLVCNGELDNTDYFQYSASPVTTGALLSNSCYMHYIYDSGNDKTYVMITKSSSPTSSGIDLRAYQAADGTYAEFIAYDVEADGSIELQLMDESGAVVWAGSVDVTAGPRSVARFLVPGLELGESYNFRVRDEVGKWWEAPGITVGGFNAEMTSLSLTGVTLSFDSLPDHEYDIQWTGELGGTWQTLTNVTATVEQTSVVVAYPEEGAAAGFFRIQVR